jgi:hypothetical protein
MTTNVELNSGRGASLAGPIIDQVRPHVDACNACADAMEAAGIGGHLVHGHAAVLRRVAAHMAAEAAAGRLPHVYHESQLAPVTAARDGGSGNVELIALAASIEANYPLAKLLGQLGVTPLAAAKMRLGNSRLSVYEVDEKLAKIITRATSPDPKVDERFAKACNQERWAAKITLKNEGFL